MLNDNNINNVIDKLNAIQASVNIIDEKLQKLQKERATFGEWVSEKEVIAITGLSRATLLKLRNSGKVSSSTISGKQLYYRLSDFKKLLDKNELEM